MANRRTRARASRLRLSADSVGVLAQAQQAAMRAVGRAARAAMERTAREMDGWQVIVVDGETLRQPAGAETMSGAAAQPATPAPTPAGIASLLGAQALEDPADDDAAGWRAQAERLRAEVVMERNRASNWLDHYIAAQRIGHRVQVVADHDGRICQHCLCPLSYHHMQAFPETTRPTTPTCSPDGKNGLTWSPSLPGAADCDDCEDAVCASHRASDARMAAVGGARGIRLKEE